MTIDRAAALDVWPLLTTVTEKLKVPAVVGVPEIKPEEELRVSPFGKAPVEIVQPE